VHTRVVTFVLQTKRRLRVASGGHGLAWPRACPASGEQSTG